MAGGWLTDVDALSSGLEHPSHAERECEHEHQYEYEHTLDIKNGAYLDLSSIHQDMNNTSCMGRPRLQAWARRDWTPHSGLLDACRGRRG